MIEKLDQVWIREMYLHDFCYWLLAMGNEKYFMVALINLSSSSLVFFLLDSTNGNFRWQFQTWHFEAKRGGQPSAGWRGARKEMYVKLVFQQFPHYPLHYLMKSVFLSLQTHVLLITTSVSCLFLYCQLLLVQELSWMKLCKMRHDDVIKFLLALIQDHYVVPEWQGFDKNYVGHDKKSISKSAVFCHIFEVRGIFFHVAWKNFLVRLFSDLETNGFNRVILWMCFSFNTTDFSSQFC